MAISKACLQSLTSSPDSPKKKKKHSDTVLLKAKNMVEFP